MACWSLPIFWQPRDHELRCPSSEQALADLLEGFGVDTASWGTNSTKPLISLLRELKEGSCTLREDNREHKKRIYRLVAPVFVQIIYCGKLLVERGKIFPNQTRREHSSVLAEKALRGEIAFHSALRGIREELQVDVTEATEGLVHTTSEDLSYVEELDSASYPGLPTVYETSHVSLHVQRGSLAERAFTHCGLPACRPFTTVEMKKEGELQLEWEWIDYHQALASGIKGMRPPAQASRKKPTDQNSPRHEGQGPVRSKPACRGSAYI